MARFYKDNFLKIIKEIELEEQTNSNFWLSIGILEFMYDDDCGYIDQYFQTKEQYRDTEELWDNLQNQLNKKNFD